MIWSSVDSLFFISSSLRKEAAGYGRHCVNQRLERCAGAGGELQGSFASGTGCEVPAESRAILDSSCLGKKIGYEFERLAFYTLFSRKGLLKITRAVQNIEETIFTRNIDVSLSNEANLKAYIIQ